MTMLLTLKLKIPLHEFTQSLSIEENVLTIGDYHPFEMSSHDDFVPNLSACNLFDDNSSSLNDRFQDVIEHSQCKISDSPLAKDFVLILGECNIFTDEPPVPSNADNLPHCLIEHTTLDSSQYDEDCSSTWGTCAIPY